MFSNGHVDKSVQTSVLDTLQSLSKTIAWGRPGPARCDFRSDVITRPSLRMLSAVVKTTLGDDVFREDPTTCNFEAHVAEISGREEGMFVITGTMANQLCLHALVSTRPCGILLSSESHAIHYEAGGPSVLSGGMLQPTQPSNGKYLRVEDLKEHAILTDDVHKCPTGIVSLENTAGGAVVPVHELRRIQDWAKENNVKTHLDGARLFEAVATGAGTLKEYCGLVDLVSVDFSKNLGAPMGAMVLGDRKLIQQMRRTRKGIGGGMRQGGVITAAAQEALFENFGLGAEMESPALGRVHEVARRLGEEWTRRGGKLSKDIETNIIWLDLDAAAIEKSQFIDTGKKHGVILDGPRVVCHHQIDSDAVEALVKVFGDLLTPGIEIATMRP
uniref:HC-toxin alanine racemase n=1 Tax=Alternaria jesenskae TaxID=378183 RepID=S5FS38_9PLEO|nr:HC-toxin alanine racemase [Alternaria jesenskae]